MLDEKQQIQYVSVLDKNNEPLMPCHPARARQLLKKGKAVRRWFRGVFAIKLTEREGGITQPIAVGVDPGSKMEGFTIKSEKHTLLNVQAHSIDWVKSSMEIRRDNRKTRRRRNTPYRECRWNRSCRKKSGRIPPSIKSRWQWKLRLLRWINRLYPVTNIIIEDIKANAKIGKRQWNATFTVLEYGKDWFYDECRKIAKIDLIKGYETSKLRKSLGLTKSSDKLSCDFNVHCVDSWVMAHKIVGGIDAPELTRVLEIIPLRFHRRQLHVANFQKGGIRKPYGTTRSLGFSRGSIVKTEKYGISYVGGFSKKGISLHDFSTGERITRVAKPSKMKFLSYNSWRVVH